MTSVETETITGATFKVRLGGLGLPPSWYAERRKVTMRTVVRWFDSDVVTGEIAADLAELEASALAEMMSILAKVPDEGPVVLKTWRTDNEFRSRRKPPMPATWHRALVFRLMEHLKAQGRDVSVIYG